MESQSELESAFDLFSIAESSHVRNGWSAFMQNTTTSRPNECVATLLMFRLSLDNRQFCIHPLFAGSSRSLAK